MTKATIITIDEIRKQTGTGSVISAESNPKKMALTWIQQPDDGKPQGEATLRSSDLYPTLSPDESEIIHATSLLQDCIKRLQEARETSEQAFVDFDEQMMRVRIALRQLFALRHIGDGFGATVNAVLWALQNKEEERISPKQLAVIIETLSQLRSKPLLHFDSAMILMDQLEDSSLNIEPVLLAEILEFENE